MHNYIPSKWYWSVAEEPRQVYSSAAAAYVSLTDTAYEAWLAAGNQPTAIDTLSDLEVVLFNAGVLNVALTSTGIPALNGNYQTDQATQAKINAVTTYIMVNGAFPAGASQLPWLDATGAAHLFPTVLSFENFATAIANFVAQAQIYRDTGQGSMPSTSIAIA